MKNINLQCLISCKDIRWVVSHRINPICGKRDKRYFLAADYSSALDFFIQCSMHGLCPRFDYTLV